MAENKKSFVMYANQKVHFEQLQDDEAGRLVKHLFRYVNDEAPEAPDRLTELLFAPIKQQLKTDLSKWSTTRSFLSEAGSKGGIKSGEVRRLKKEALNQNEANRSQLKPGLNIEAVNVNANANVNVNANVNKEKEEGKPAAEAASSSKKNKKDFEINIPNNIAKPFQEWLEMRKKTKRPATDYAIYLSLKALQKLSADPEIQIQIIERSIVKSWTDFYPLPTNNNYGAGKQTANGNKGNSPATGRPFGKENL